MKVGELSRDGMSRTLVEALDHDFKPDAVVVPVGILVPKTGELSIYIVPIPLTADAIADAIEDWWRTHRAKFPEVGRLVIDQDNGPENNSRRTQFMSRIVQFGEDAVIHVELAYYPPYHSKYNPIERCWASLEKYWNGALLDSIEAVVRYASNMTWKGMHPIVKFVNHAYETGKSLTAAAMRGVESRLQRHATLGRWFVDIPISIP